MERYKTETETREERLIRRRAMKGTIHLRFPKVTLPNEEMESIFVLSTGKCGTVTMTGFFDLTDKILAFHEPQPRLWHLSGKAFSRRGSLDNGLLDKVVEGARRDIIEVANSEGYVYAECANRMTYFCYNIKRIFPKTRFVYVNRNLDDFVRSAYTWGFYHEHDKYLTGRITPANIANMSRSQIIAWSWGAINTYIMDFLETIPRKDWFYFPFSWMEGRQTELIHLFYDWLGYGQPEDDHIKEVLDVKANSQARIIPIEKDWGDVSEDAVFNRIGGMING